MDTVVKTMGGVDSGIKLICLQCLHSTRGSVKGELRAALYKLDLTTHHKVLE